MNGDIVQAVNTLCSYLALRHLERPELLYEQYGIRKADVILVLGSDLPCLAEKACALWNKGLAKYLVFCGGVGHSTGNLKEKAGKIMGRDVGELPDSEAELYAVLAEKQYHVPEKAVIIEKNSTNTAENVKYAMRILEEKQIRSQFMLLMQDPILQRRSYVTALDFVPEETLLISYAPFIPSVSIEGNRLPDIPYLWEEGRFYELLLGEMRRLRDDGNGYGPKGKGFIRHVDIPEEAEAACRIVSEHFARYDTRVTKE